VNSGISRWRVLGPVCHYADDAVDTTARPGCGGKVLSEAIVALLAFSALNYLPVLLSLTLFITS